MNKKKVWLIIPTLGGGGAEKMVLDLARSINAEKYKVTVVSLYNKTYAAENRLADIEKYQISTLFLNKKPGFDFHVLLQLKKMIQEQQPDIIHSNLESFQYVFPLAWLLRKRHVHTMHSVGGKEQRIYRWILKNAYRNHNFYMVALSHRICTELILLYPKLGDHLCVVRNGVDIKQFSFYQAKTAKKDFNFICVASLTPVKNHKLLFEAFATLQHKYGRMDTLTLVGDGPLHEELMAKTKQLGIDKNVIFVGNTANVADYLKQADAFVLASHYEGVPLAILEAMCTSLPILAPDVGGVGEIVIGNGMLFPVEDREALTAALYKMAVDTDFRCHCGQVSFERAKQFDLGIMAHEYENLYER